MTAQQQVRGGAAQSWSIDLGEPAAFIKRLVNARTVSFDRRASHHAFECPGEDDGADSCARDCTAEHLGALRAFTVTGLSENLPPPPPIPVHSPPYPPPPPSAPFTKCSNACSDLVDGDSKCRDGGYNSYLPTRCQYSSQCSACGFRENTRTIVQDDSCVHSKNGLCQDGGLQSSYILDELYGGLTSVCGLGTDRCAHLFSRTGRRPCPLLCTHLAPGRATGPTVREWESAWHKRQAKIRSMA